MNVRDLNKVFRAANRMYKLRMKTAYGTETAIHENDQISPGPNSCKKLRNLVSQSGGWIEYSIIFKARTSNVSMIKQIDERRLSLS